MRIIRVLIAIISVTFIYYGVARGEVSIIFNKAARICMECIGLG